MQFEKLINPQSIVVVGGSNNLSSAGGSILKKIIAGNYKGKLLVVNPKEKEVQGVPCIQDLSSAPQFDLAIIAVASKFVKEYVNELCSKCGVKACIIVSAGFGEMGEDGKKLEREIVQIIEKHNALLIGPNCIGVLTPHYHGVFAGPIPKLDPHGCDFASSSGSVAVFIIEKGMEMGLSFSSLFSVGNAAQIGVEDVVKLWDETYDPKNSSRIKLLYMETVKKPQMLLKHASSLIRKGCKIAAIKAGNSEGGSRAASSHTGAMISSDVAVQALFKKAGIVRCNGREELALTAGVFASADFKGKNIAVVTHAGGPGVMLTDTLESYGIKIPQLKGPAMDELLSTLLPGSAVGNPIDFLATGTKEHVLSIIDTIENKCPTIDAMAFIYGDPGLMDVIPVLDCIVEKQKSCTKPIFPIFPSITTNRKQLEQFKAKGGIYFSDEVFFGRSLANILNTPKPADIEELPTIDTKKIRSIIDSSENGYLPPVKIQQLLDAVRIPRIDEQVYTNVDDCVSFCEKIGYPVVMKVVGPLHKSDVGGVVINVKDKESVISHYKNLMAIKDAEAVLIQPMVKGMELFAGAKYEENFGHLIVCGLGGIYVEILKDTVTQLSPIGYTGALDMIQSLKSRKLLDGFRGNEGVNIETYARILSKLSALLEAAPEIAELDLNPLIGTKERITVVDSRMRIQKR